MCTCTQVSKLYHRISKVAVLFVKVSTALCRRLLCVTCTPWLYIGSTHMVCNTCLA
ncbi:hypothetical protein PAHAL_9G182900 [Panicum hallii]|uniref:Uncharacterized protein n=1 Tax=Panicum hallii TaxID=206008 RepID=A0A2T8I1M5_9POAL|nr:hypothetical protein PAHAL_9G182900 [Panicum hallii]